MANQGVEFEKVNDDLETGRKLIKTTSEASVQTELRIDDTDGILLRLENLRIKMRKDD